MKFNSQICTTKEQSERLLALGLKKETADLAYEYKPKLLPIYDSGSCLLDKLYEVLLQLVEMKDEFTDIVGHKEYGNEEAISKVLKLKEEIVI